MDKINFNKFIWFYWKMKKKITIFDGFPVAGMRKKMMNEKKNKICSEVETGWATAHLSHDTMVLYRDTARLGSAGVHSQRP